MRIASRHAVAVTIPLLCSVACLVAGLGCASIPRAAAASPRPADATSCDLAEADKLWIQQALDLWAITRKELLHLPDAPIPWTVFFDRRCAYHLNADATVLPGALPLETALSFAGRPLTVHGRRHEDGVWLPSGGRAPIGFVAQASTYRDGGGGALRPFYVMALMPIWRTHPERTPDLSDEMLTVAQHELAHTEQIVALHAKVLDLHRQASLRDGNLDDSTIQRRFQDDGEYVRAFSAERDLLYRAVAASGRERQALLRDVLRSMRRRQAAFFVGQALRYGEIESLFLALEGTGEWVRYEILKRVTTLPRNAALERVDPTFRGWRRFRGMSYAQRIDFVRGPRKEWSQEQGLPLAILIDALVPGWQERMFAPSFPSPYELLEAALSSDDKTGTVQRPSSATNGGPTAKQAHHKRMHRLGSYSKYPKRPPASGSSNPTVAPDVRWPAAVR